MSPLRFLQGGEDVVRRIHSLRGSSDSDLESNEAIPTHDLNDRTNPLVTAIASSLPETKPTGEEIEVIVNNDDIFEGDAESVCGFLNRFSAQIHIGERFEKNNLLTIERSFPIDRPESSG